MKGRKGDREKGRRSFSIAPPPSRPLLLSPLLPLAKAFLLAGLLLASAGCDDTAIDPFVNEDRFFTIYGYLDATQAEHAVRVIPITRSPEKIENPKTASIDAEVTSTNLNTGTHHAWDHSVEKLSNGLFAHIFRAQFRVRARDTYRLEVRRSDGVRAWAQTTVPLLTDPALFDRAPYAVSPDSSEITQEVFIRGVPSPGDLLVSYRYIAQTPDVFGEDGTTVRSSVSIPYGRSGDRTDAGWRFTLNLSADQTAVRESIIEFLEGGQFIGAVTVISMGVQMKVLDDGWVLPPTGEINLDTLAQPGAFSNVENGYGFWGSIGLYIQEWAVPPDLSQLLDD